MSKEQQSGFGTSAVFLTAISTILGAVMFLRFGFSVGSVGFMGTLVIILIGHLVTIPTAMALAEIATNQKVEGGGEYFIISRSFGINIGASIGFALYLSQAISVAFYVIAFAEAFTALAPWLKESFNIVISDNRVFSIPALILLILLMVTKGADLGMKMLYIVVGILGISLVFFFLGGSATSDFTGNGSILLSFYEEKDFFYVFAIIFPAFTGMTAGVGLSGDLKDPSKSIPRGTIWATVVGMFVYILLAYKLYTSASIQDLLSKQLIMQDISIWGPIIPLGLAAATISSAIGSFMVAPRTLQALAVDKVFPHAKINNWFTKGVRSSNEPRNATIFTSLIALIFVMIGDVNVVAEVISMFFMVTYGSLCLISFLQHFSGDPAYRPTFKSRWYISLLGSLLCLYLMFKINTVYAIAALLLMLGIYFGISTYLKKGKGVAQIFLGVGFQFVRRVQVFLQKSEKDMSPNGWRPAIVGLSKANFAHNDAFDLLRWISKKYGFGTYILYHQGYYSKENKAIAKTSLKRLLEISNEKNSNVFLETLISPSNTNAIVQVLQQPGVSGHDNNMLLLEFEKGNDEWLTEIVENYKLIKTANHDVAVLSISDRSFGDKKDIHVWIKRDDVDNANMMILMAYIIAAHREWRDSEIKIFAAFKAEDMESEKENLIQLTSSGRLPISAFNIIVLELKQDTVIYDLINAHSKEADLTILGFHESRMKSSGINVFKGYDSLGNILFLNTIVGKHIE